ncbi:MAG TPA: dephospho-CoA kinase [Pyrinomonadaceae bacterium]|jgi:dephospho-CoA kinase|nr:dephospho-CoA kinase [Pyrinomonadaceae bacterium]
MLKVGLTGSIAVGKSFVLRTLAELGCHVIDADEVAREVVAPGTPGLQMVRAAFGPDVLRVDGALDRAKLGAIVFADSDKRAHLNSILHPLIIATQDERLRTIALSDPNAIVVIDAALMIESGGYRRFDKLIVVHCRPELQLQRLRDRDHLSRQAAELRIAAQMTQDEKKRHGDFLIDTSNSFDDTRKQVTDVYESLRALTDREASSTK